MLPSVWVCALAVVMLIAGCGRSADREERVRLALEQANLASVGVDEESGMVRLTGTVETLAERTRAEEIASAVVGTSGQVVNELAVERLEGPSGDH